MAMILKHFKQILLPVDVRIHREALNHVSKLVGRYDLRNVVIVTGPRTNEIAGKKVEELICTSDECKSKKFIVKTASRVTAKKIEQEIRGDLGEYDAVLGVGGGKVLDVAKVVAFHSNALLISIPTNAAHDGIASPLASFKEKGMPISIKAASPVSIIADLEIIRNSPVRLLRSGYGDLISNLVEVKDWLLGVEKIDEDYDEIVASISSMPAMLLLKSADELDFRDAKYLKLLVRGLILGGLAINMYGTSRPVSGSAHKFSHALDYLGYGRGTHGEQVGIGTIIMEYMHQHYYGEGDWELLKYSLEKILAPTTAREIGLTKKQMLEALMYAKNIRPSRYTILEDQNPSKKDFEICLEKTGVAK
jgi:glycerol-1-phosphate dehydrogenase [NAD(P)+]